jgi:2,4-dienoyl-CoA reductase-like NADH-dependent reductase (Old Yellow Enzyme family)
MNLIIEIIEQTREATGPGFVLGIKLNSKDHTDGRFTVVQAREHILRLAAVSIDFIEISGGDYENPGSHSFFLDSGHVN